MLPATVMRPIRLPAYSVNQYASSLPCTIASGPRPVAGSGQTVCEMTWVPVMVSVTITRPIISSDWIVYQYAYSGCAMLCGPITLEISVGPVIPVGLPLLGEPGLPGTAIGGEQHVPEGVPAIPIPPIPVYPIPELLLLLLIPAGWVIVSGIEYSVMLPSVVTRPITLAELDDSAYQIAPS